MIIISLSLLRSRFWLQQFGLVVWLWRGSVARETHHHALFFCLIRYRSLVDNVVSTGVHILNTLSQGETGASMTSHPIHYPNVIVFLSAITVAEGAIPRLSSRNPLDLFQNVELRTWFF